MGSYICSWYWFLHLFLRADVEEMGRVSRPYVPRFQSLSSEKYSFPSSDHLQRK